jgi:serine/threonine protein kinase
MQEGEFLVERYRLVRKVGRGAMGQVWLAYDNLLNRHVAVKHLLMGSGQSLDDDVVKRAMREARVAAQLNHPNVVQIFDLVMTAGMPYVVMEFVEGETLASRLESAGRLTPQTVRPWIRQVATCLAAAHELGIVHRDVKPANILITPNGVAKLADFGIARASQDADLTRTGLVIGTLAYMAPEVAAGDPATPASDVWSLGATAYAATEGRAPFAGESSARALYRKVSEPPPRPTGAGELTELMLAMMATEPTHRPVARDAASSLEGTGPVHRSGASSPPPLEPTYVSRVVPAVDRPPVQENPQGGVHAGHFSAEDRYRETGTWSPDPRTTGPGTTGSHHRRGGLIAAAVVLVLAIAGGSLALVLGNQSGSPASAGSTQARTTTPVAAAAPTAAPTPTPASSTALSPVTSGAVVAAPVTSPVITTPVESTVGTMSYSGPNGLSVDGPASWDNSCTGADGPYYWCAGPEGFLGGYFRLRLKNAHTASFDADVRSEISYFRTKYRDGVVTSASVSGWSVSGAAVDLSYSFTNSQGQTRRGIERVFAVNGARTVTYIIAATDTRSAWPRTQQVFQQLVTSARI